MTGFFCEKRSREIQYIGTICTCRADSCSSSCMLCNAEIQPWKGQQKAAETRVPGKTSSPHLSHDFFKLLDNSRL